MLRRSSRCRGLVEKVLVLRSGRCRSTPRQELIDRESSQPFYLELLQRQIDVQFLKNRSQPLLLARCCEARSSASFLFSLVGFFGELDAFCGTHQIVTPVTWVCSREEGRKIVFFRQTCQEIGVLFRSANVKDIK